MLKTVAVAVVGVALTGLLGACATSEPSTGSSAAIVPAQAAEYPTAAYGADSGTATGATDTDKVISATLKSFSITPSATTFAPGSYTLQATNTADVEHEMVLVKTDLAVEDLPYDAGKQQLDEDKITGKVGEVEAVQPGTTKDSEESFVLGPGRYVLFCNIAAHFQQGMHAVIEVK